MPSPSWSIPEEFDAVTKTLNNHSLQFGCLQSPASQVTLAGIAKLTGAGVRAAADAQG
jgi:hypothetical protein